MRLPSVVRQPWFKRWARWLLFPALLVLNYVLITVLLPGRPQRVEVSYTFFKQQVVADNVASRSAPAPT